MDEDLRIAVIGAGIGGMAAAMALHRAGLRVEVFEQAGELAEVGAGIHLAPNGSRLLDRFGLTPALERVAVRPEVLEVRGWDSGQVMVRQPMGEQWAAAFGGAHYTLHRADLHRLLIEQVPAELVHLDKRCTGFAEDADGVWIDFADGTRHRADVLVGADGVHSVVRRATAGTDRPVFSGTAALRGVVPAELLPGLAMDRMYVWTGPGTRMLAAPVQGGGALSFVAVVPDADSGTDSWSRESDPAALVAAFEGWEPEVLALVRAAAEVGHWSLYDREPLAHWSTGRTTLLGDAAHPMLPHHGQGASQAIEDAVALAHLLARAGGDVPSALRGYEELRLAHTSLVREQALAGGSQRLAKGQGPQGPQGSQGGQGPQGGHGGPGGMSKLMEDITWVQRYDVEAALAEPALSV